MGTKRQQRPYLATLWMVGALISISGMAIAGRELSSELNAFQISFTRSFLCLLSLFGLLAIIGSLIFVGIEIRQNSMALRGETHQSISEQVTELYMNIASDERLSKLVSQMLLFNSANDSLRNNLSAADQLSLDFIVLTGLRRVENIYLQESDGILSENAFDRIGMEFYQTTFSRETWEKYKTGFDKSFINFFEKLRDNK